MFTISKKTEHKIQEGLNKYKRIIRNAQNKDFNEADTVAIIIDMLDEIWGYDKYEDVTSEYAIRNIYCDLAIKIRNKAKILIEVKAAGIKLKQDHTRQAVEYGTNEGTPWVVLTNGAEWHLYKVIFNRKPVVIDHIMEFNLIEMQSRNFEDLEKLYTLTKEGVTKSRSSLDEMFEHHSTVNKYMIGQLILDESTVAHLRRLIRKISPDIKVAPEVLSELISNEVLKRDVLDPESTKDYRRIINRKLKD